MIISVICPNCGKKIQIDDSNDANICVCCGKAFVTLKAKVCDENINLKESNEPKVNESTDKANHYYNNIIGLLEKNDEDDLEVLNANLKKFKLEYPMDPKVALCEYLIQLSKYEKSKYHDFNDIKNFISSLNKLKNSGEFFPKYHQELLDKINSQIKSSVSEDMIDVKIYLENLDIDCMVKNDREYQREMVIYKKECEKYKKECEEYEEKYEKYKKAMDAYRSAVINDSYLPSFPMEPYKPHHPTSPFIPTYGKDYINSILPLLKVGEYGIDVDYLLNKYNELKSKEQILTVNLDTYKSLINKIFSLFPKEIKDKLYEEEKQKQEKQRKEKEAKIIEEIKKFWNKYFQILKYNGPKEAYKYLKNPIVIQGKTIYTYHEMMKYKKSLFSVKYLDELSNFDLDKTTSISYKNMNYKL